MLVIEYHYYLNRKYNMTVIRQLCYIITCTDIKIYLSVQRVRFEYTAIVLRNLTKYKYSGTHIISCRYNAFSKTVANIKQQTIF